MSPEPGLAAISCDSRARRDTNLDVQQREPRREVLVIGEALSSANLAVELRMRGIRACVVATEEEFFALCRQAWLRPTVALVDLMMIGGEVRDAEVRRRSLIAALAGVPTVLVGADGNDVPLFADVVRVLPDATRLDDVAQAIRDWSG